MFHETISLFLVRNQWIFERYEVFFLMVLAYTLVNLICWWWSKSKGFAIVTLVSGMFLLTPFIGVTRF